MTAMTAMTATSTMTALRGAPQQKWYTIVGLVLTVQLALADARP